MTIANQNFRNDYVASAGQTIFQYAFRILDEDHIQVYVNGVLKTIVTHYTVSNVGEQNGGNVTFLVGLLVGDKVAILLNPTFTQETDYVFNTKFPAETHETALDKVTQLALFLKGKMARALKFTDFSTHKDIAVPEPVANQFLKWNATADGLENSAVVATASVSGSNPADVGSAAAPGVAVTVPRQDHVHAHPDTGSFLPNAHHAKFHQAAHNSGGGDALKLDDLATPDDNTDLNVSIIRHGLVPKLPNDAGLFLNGIGGFTAAVAAFKVTVITATGTFAKDAKAIFCRVQAVGAGGGGGSADSAAGEAGGAGGGGGGGYCEEWLLASALAASEDVTIGAAGLAGTGNGGNGGNGGNTTFGAAPFFTASGGVGGTGSGSAAATAADLPGGAGGAAAGGQVNIPGQAGADSFTMAASGEGGAVGGQGGDSLLGHGGGQVIKRTTGTKVGITGGNFGGGGSGAANVADINAADGGAGAPGVIVVTEFLKA